MSPGRGRTAASTGWIVRERRDRARWHGVAVRDDAPAPSTAAALRRARRRRVERVAAGQAGVVSRRQLLDLGLTRWEIEAELRAERWRRVGRQAIAVHRGPLTRDARHRIAVLEAGPRAFLDAWSALEEAGLQGFDGPTIRVSVPRGARVFRRLHGVDIRQTRRWHPDDVRDRGIPCARAEVAAIRAALWCLSDRQAALVLCMVVQQGLATPYGLAVEFLRIRRDRRRALVHQVLLDLSDGVRAVGERDVVRECRRRGLPPPSLQALRRTSRGTYFLDLVWEEWKVAVEVDGIQHSWAANVAADAVRQNALSMTGYTVLRVPLLGLRTQPDTFYAQIAEALRRAGWGTPRSA